MWPRQLLLLGLVRTDAAAESLPSRPQTIPKSKAEAKSHPVLWCLLFLGLGAAGFVGACLPLLLLLLLVLVLLLMVVAAAAGADGRAAAGCWWCCCWRCCCCWRRCCC